MHLFIFVFYFSLDFYYWAAGGGILAVVIIHDEDVSYLMSILIFSPSSCHYSSLVHKKSLHPMLWSTVVLDISIQQKAQSVLR